MARQNRRDVIDESEVGLYHVWSRCVRQEFLFAVDPLTGEDNSHRRDWIIDRMEFLCGSYAIEACSYAILSNHYHLLFRNRPDLLLEWSDEEVVCRWWRLNPKRYGGEFGVPPSQKKIRSFLDTEGWVETHRKRLGSPSWYMQFLNQDIARRANLESGKWGHFFAKRFGARRLEEVLETLSCSLYVDLNELRAGVASCLEESLYSSVVRRIARLKKGEQALLDGDHEAAVRYAPDDPDYWLCPVDEDDRAPPLGTDSLWLPTGWDAGGREGAAEEQQDSDDPEQTVANPVEASEGGEREQGEAEAGGTSTRGCESTPQASSGSVGSDSTSPGRPRHGFLPVTLKSYLELADLEARRESPGKARMDPSLPPLLERVVGATPEAWRAAFERTAAWFLNQLGVSHLADDPPAADEASPGDDPSPSDEAPPGIEDTANDERAGPSDPTGFR